MSAGDNIKKIRKQKGLTQKQLGELCGLADSAIRRYENGRANPKYETKKKIADALGTNVWQLIDTVEQADDLVRHETEERKNDTEHHFKGWIEGNDIHIQGMIVEEKEYVEFSFEKETYLLTEQQTKNLPQASLDLLKNYIRGIGKDITARHSDGSPM